MTNIPVALQAVTNELREMRAELVPFIGAAGPARNMTRRLDRVLALLERASAQVGADDSQHRTNHPAWVAERRGEARYD